MDSTKLDSTKIRSTKIRSIEHPPAAAGLPATAGGGAVNFELEWRALEPAADGQGEQGLRRALILAGDDPLAHALAEVLGECGWRAELARWSEHALDDEARLTRVLERGRHDAVWLVAGAPELHPRIPSPAELHRHLRRSLGLQVACARALVGRLEAGLRAPSLRVLTCGATGAERPQDLAGALQAGCWGLLQAIRAEHPQLDAAIVDLDPNDDPRTAARRFLAALGLLGREPQLALRGDRRLAPRLAPTKLDDGAVIELDGAAAYLVVGGLGQVGGELCRWLVDRGARSLVIVGRRSLDGGELDLRDPDQRRRAELLAELEARGVEIELARLDIRDRAAVQAFARRRAETSRGRRVIRGAVHAASDAEATPLALLDPADVPERVAVKIAGACNLHAVFGALDPLLLCTSIASQVPALARGLGCDAAADATLDALAAALRARGIAATALAFGPWQGARSRGLGGERGPSDLADLGLGCVEPTVAARALDGALAGARAGLVCARLDAHRVVARTPSSSRVFDELLDRGRVRPERA